MILSRSRAFALPCLLLLAACSKSAAPAFYGTERAGAKPVGISGVLDGAPYRIDIPEHWNGRLVMLLHGYEPKGRERPAAWPTHGQAPLLLQRGFAVAASANSTQGWAVAEAIVDNERLRQHFVDTYGKPERTYLFGASLGAHIALAMLEKDAQDFDGALDLCGVNLPASEAFSEGIFTPLVAFDALFPGALPLGDAGLADLVSAPAAGSATTDAAFNADASRAAAIEAALKTDEAKTALLVKGLEIPRAELAGALMLRYLVLREMQQRAGGNPVDNRAVHYTGFGDDEAFNKSVRRYEANAAAASYVARNANLTGNVHKPVVIYPNLGDPTVPLHLSKRYAELAQRAGNGAWVVTLPPTGDGHCDYTEEQMGEAMVYLANWAESGHAGTPAGPLAAASH